ncbi:MAG: hypothetical protein NZ534_09290 [Bacteroidia bacterium]|nr:hypothetical protein [Bacteroidia bacterium]
MQSLDALYARRAGPKWAYLGPVPSDDAFSLDEVVSIEVKGKKPTVDEANDFLSRFDPPLPAGAAAAAAARFLRLAAAQDAGG